MSDLMEEEAEGEFQALNTPIDDLAVKYELVAKMQPDLTARQRKVCYISTILGVHDEEAALNNKEKY